MKIAILAASLFAVSTLAAAADGSRPAPISAPGGSGLVTYADLPAFLAATADMSLNFEAFAAHDSFNVSPCYEPVNGDSGQPGTSFLEPVCFHPGDVIGGFDVRSNLDWTSGITNPWGTMVGPGLFFIGSNSMSPGPASNAVGATFSAATKTLMDFRDRPVAVSMDTYDLLAGSPVTVEVYAAHDSLLGSVTLMPSAPNAPSFAGFTSSVPIAEVVVRSASGASQLIGNLRFGGVPGKLTVNASTLDLGPVAIGDTASQSLQIENTGNADVTIGTIAAAAAPFAIAADDCSGATVAAGDSCSLTVDFAPALERAYADVLAIPSSDIETPSHEIDLHGRGVVPTLSAAPSSIDFGTVAVGDSAGPLSATLSNTTAVPLSISAVVAPAAPFATAAGGTCVPAPFDLAPGQSCTLAYSFAPQQDGVFHGRVVVESSDPSSPGVIMLRGAAGDVIFADGFEAQ